MSNVANVSSIVRAMELVRDQKADAVVSAGNTGGIFASASFKLKRIEGVRRGGIATVIPTAQQHFVLLDSGANIECKPIDLAQFALMGNIYAKEILGYPNPRVGVLSIGTEPNKGNELTLGAYGLCKQLPLNFVGNVEGHDLFENHVDVVVCDGFVGNIVLKTCESLAMAMFSLIKQEMKASARRQLAAILAKHATDPDVDPRFAQLFAEAPGSTRNVVTVPVSGYRSTSNRPGSGSSMSAWSVAFRPNALAWN